ncbi:MAG: hypothetical protein ACE5EL_03170, partial [Anaerolineae bacterium]
MRVHSRSGGGGRRPRLALAAGAAVSALAGTWFMAGGGVGAAPPMPIAFAGQEGGSFGDAAADGSRLYAVRGPRVVALQPEELEVGAESEVLGGVPRALAAAGGRVYAAMGLAGLAVMDASDPGRLPVVAVLPVAADLVAAGGDVAFVASGGEVTVVDTRKLDLPLVVGRLEASSWLGSLAARGSVAYGGSTFDQLDVIDATDLLRPRMAVPATAVVLADAEDMAVAGEAPVLLVADGENGFRIMDLADPLAPIEVGGQEGYALRVAAAADRAYVALGDQDGDGVAVTAFDATVLPRLEPSARAVFDPFTIALAATPGRLHVLEVDRGLATFSGAPTLTLEARLPARPDFRVAVAPGGTKAWVLGAPGDPGRLRLVDVADPTRPHALGALDTPGQGRGVAAAPGLAFVADGSAGLTILTAGAGGPGGAGPEVAATLAVAGEAQGVAYEAPYAYIA